MSALGPGCVKSRTGQKCVKSISLLPSRDGAYWRYFVYQINEIEKEVLNTN